MLVIDADHRTLATASRCQWRNTVATTSHCVVIAARAPSESTPNMRPNTAVYLAKRFAFRHAAGLRWLGTSLDPSARARVPSERVRRPLCVNATQCGPAPDSAPRLSLVTRLSLPQNVTGCAVDPSSLFAACAASDYSPTKNVVTLWGGDSLRNASHISMAWPP